MFAELVRKNRSYRRFFENEPLGEDLLTEWISLARLTPNGANKQAIRYVLSSQKETNEKIYAQLGWAGYFPDWDGPAPGERPGAYIILLQQASCKAGSPYDIGIAAQTILLAAVEKGYGGCMLGNIHREELKKDLQLAEDLEILLVLALGKPKETVVIDDISPGENIRYWRERDGTHHVPKIKTEDLILK